MSALLKFEKLFFSKDDVTLPLELNGLKRHGLASFFTVRISYSAMLAGGKWIRQKLNPWR
jgi:hypothetical protein